MNKQNNKQEQTLLKDIWSFKKTILLTGIAFSMIFFSVSAMIPPSYKAFSSVAVNQMRTGGLDAYREAKSSEFIARTIKEMIVANSFMQEVINKQEINWAEMDQLQSHDKQIKLWRKKIKISVVPNTGVLHIAVYTRNKKLSKEIATAIVNNLQEQKMSFFDNKGIKLTVIDSPYYFEQPAFPNLLLNIIVGFFVGVVLVIALVFINSNLEEDAMMINLGINKAKRKKNSYVQLSEQEFNKNNIG